METQTITTSQQFRLNMQDLGKGLIVAVLAPVIPIVQASISAGQLTFDWKVIGTAALGGFVAYLAKNFFTPAQTVIVTPTNTPDKP